MKKLFLLTLTLGGVLAAAPLVSAQNTSTTTTQKSEINVRVEQNVDGKITIQEKTIDATGMNADQRQALIDSVQDNMIAGNYGTKRTKIIIEDNDQEDRFSYRDGENGNVRIYAYKGVSPESKKNYENSEYRFKFGDQEWQRNLDSGIHRFDDNLQIWGENLSDRLESMGKSRGWDNRNFLTNSTSVRSLDIFSNRPDTHIVNVRFYAPAKGDVAIKIMDVNGKIVTSEIVKDFKGDYVGQMELKMDSKGTFFVLVTQNEDGLTKRFVID